MNHLHKVAVLGGGGKTGNFLVRRLLKAHYQLKLLLRHPADFQIDSPSIEIIKGDARDPEAIQALLKECQAVVSTVGQRKDEPLVFSLATQNILDAMKENGIRRYISLAGLNLDTPLDHKGEATRMATDWMNANFPVICADNQKAYGILADSEVDWTVVRVPLILFSGESAELVVDLQDCAGTKVNAVDIADFFAEQLSENQYFGKAPFISNP